VAAGCPTGILPAGGGFACSLRNALQSDVSRRAGDSPRAGGRLLHGRVRGPLAHRLPPRRQRLPRTCWRSANGSPSRCPTSTGTGTWQLRRTIFALTL